MLYQNNREQEDFIEVNVLYHNLFEGYDAYVCGSGPSLIDTRVYNRSPMMSIIGVSKSYPYSSADFLVNSSVDIKNFDMVSFYENNEIFLPYSNENHSLANISPKVRWYESSDASDVNDLFGEGKGLHPDTFIWNSGSSLETALHIALFLGHRTIYLLGCDFSLDNGDYCSEWATLNSEEREIQSNSFKLRLVFLEKFVSGCGQANIKINSCTPDSPMNSFMEYLSVEDALESTLQKFINRDTPDFLELTNRDTPDFLNRQEDNVEVSFDSDESLFNEDLFSNLII